MLALLLVAANLRSGITGVGPLIPAIERDTGMSAGMGGLLSTIPMLAFGLVSPLVGREAARFGIAKVLTVALALLSIGIVARSLPGLAFLFLGTVLMSIAIAHGNVLLPAAIRANAPANQVGALSAAYVTVMGAFAALSSGVTVPLSRVLPGGWRAALAIVIVPAVLALIVWSLRLADGRHDLAVATRRHTPIPWRSGVAWQVTAFMGLQSLIFFTILAWLPSIVAEGGISAGRAGLLLLVLQLVGLASSAVVPIVARAFRDQRWLVGINSMLIAAGIAVLLVDPAYALFSVVLLGLGGGAVVVLALSFQSERARTGDEAAALAGMAQSLGYLLAATGPLLVGVLHQATGGWRLPTAVLLGLAVLMGLVGAGASRSRFAFTTELANATQGRPGEGTLGPARGDS